MSIAYEKLVAEAKKKALDEKMTIISVGPATCENASGAEELAKEFQKHSLSSLLE